MQALKDDGGARRELPQYLGRVHLVWHLGTEAGRTGVATPGKDVACLRHAYKRCTYPALTDQLVHRGRRQQVAEVAGQRVGAAEQGPQAPMLGCEQPSIGGCAAI
jgi:hypothetical protein